MMNSVKLIFILAAALSVFGLQNSVSAATAAGAGIELDGKYVGGYTITLNGETRADLAAGLANNYITFERNFKIKVDPNNKLQATLKGKIRILSKIRGDREVEATADSLKLIKKKNKWYVDADSLKKALAAGKNP